jgi:hypothetical protein
MFKEIVDLAKFVKEIADQRRAKVTGWRRVYDVYRKLDAVIDSSVTAVEHYLPVPLDAPFLVHTTFYPSPLAKWVSVTNEDFRNLDVAVKEFLGSLHEIDQALEIYDSELAERIHFHFWFKSLWLRRFADAVMVGEVSSDGRLLRKTVLKLAARIDKAAGCQPASRDEARIVESLVVAEEFDLSQETQRAALVAAGRRNVEALKAVRAELASFIKSNCRIEDIL